MTETVKPGHEVQRSGIYESGGKRATLVKDKPAPPTPKPNQPWVEKVDTRRGKK